MTRDIYTAICTARTALETGNVPRARNAMTFAAHRLGLKGGVASKAPEANLVAALECLERCYARKVEEATEKRAEMNRLYSHVR